MHDITRLPNNPVAGIIDHHMSSTCVVLASLGTELCRRYRSGSPDGKEDSVSSPSARQIRQKLEDFVSCPFLESWVCPITTISRWCLPLVHYVAVQLNGSQLLRVYKSRSGPPQGHLSVRRPNSIHPQLQTKPCRRRSGRMVRYRPRKHDCSPAAPVPLLSGPVWSLQT